MNYISKSLIVISLMLLSANTFAQKIYQNNIAIITNTEVLPTKENSKVVEYSEYSYNERYGEFEKSDFALEKYRYVYDDSGKIIESRYIFESKGVNRTEPILLGYNSEVFHYNDNEKLIDSEIKKMNSDDNQYSYFVVKYIYDDKDNIVTKNVYDKKYGKLKFKYTFKYDTQNRIIEYNEYYGEHLITNTYNYSYNEKNDFSIKSRKQNATTYEIYFYAGGSFPDSIKVHSNMEANQLEGAETKIYKYENNSNGNWIVRNESIKSPDDFNKIKPLKSIERKFYTQEELTQIEKRKALDKIRKQVITQNYQIEKKYSVVDEIINGKYYYKIQKKNLYNSYVKIYESSINDYDHIEQLNELQQKVIALVTENTKKLEKSLKDQSDLSMMQRLIMSF